jgi:hypothetical protein
MDVIGLKKIRSLDKACEIEAPSGKTLEVTSSRASPI